MAARYWVIPRRQLAILNIANPGGSSLPELPAMLLKGLEDAAGRAAERRKDRVEVAAAAHRMRAMDMKVSSMPDGVPRQPRIRAHDARHRIHRARIPTPAEARGNRQGRRPLRIPLQPAVPPLDRVSLPNNISPKSPAARPAQALRAEPSVLDAAHSVGLSGGGRLHDLTVTLEAMTPGEIRAGGEGVTHSPRHRGHAIRNGVLRRDAARSYVGLPSSSWPGDRGTAALRDRLAEGEVRAR